MAESQAPQALEAPSTAPAGEYDVLVVGSGIGGMESALKLGDMGYKVLLVEKEASVGGKMILLSKVFPTLDCASCISTPKMAASIHHPNVTTLPVLLNKFQSAVDGRLYGPQAAIGTVITIPVVVLGILIQKHLVKGFSFGMVRR